jgi:dihydroorotate dehydrogenase electron transfer subunit
VEVATEDGSMGLHGLVTDLLNQFLARPPADGRLEGFACGPRGMLQVVQELANTTSFAWQASFEERMACGMGVCMGCVIQAKGGGYRITCSNGPVFDLKEMVFDA